MKVENDVPTIFNPRKPRLSQSNAVLTADHRPYGPFSHVLSRSESRKRRSSTTHLTTTCVNDVKSRALCYSVPDRGRGAGGTVPAEAVGRVQEAEEQMLFETREKGTSNEYE